MINCIIHRQGLLTLLLTLYVTAVLTAQNSTKLQYHHPIPFDPNTYLCQYVSDQIIIDGQLNDSAWIDIPWTAAFTDIQGALQNKPFLPTQAKMCWDDDYFYIAAVMIEPHIWATLTERDAIMYQDDDFEIFIDPDGDGHNYFEFEMNAHNAIWDLYMLYPYRIDDGRNYIMNWDIRGIRHAVDIVGTLNDPTDIDSSWSVEVAIPWDTFKDFKAGRHRPIHGDQWRINFSRVDWTMEIINGQYHKVVGANHKPLPENNWVWSPMGYINMHQPELWGYVQFVNGGQHSFDQNPAESVKWGLWQLYYQLGDCRRSEEYESCTIDRLSMPKEISQESITKLELSTDPYGFRLSLEEPNGVIYTINEKAQLKVITSNKP